ncbi:MAG: hypothetical protein ABI597_00810 [Gammaproteobacteria bacterium]
MRLYRIGFALASLFLATPIFATQCPSAEQVRSCHGGECTFQQISGWNEKIFYTDQGKPFVLHTSDVENTSRGKKISCYYTYLNPQTHRSMPLALVLKTIVN